jgi:hypothetical protein
MNEQVIFAMLAELAKAELRCEYAKDMDNESLLRAMAWDTPQNFVHIYNEQRGDNLLTFKGDDNVS